ncbi:MAG: hypothetical protein V4618_12930 [Pseudomonadota bacterium]
MNKLMLMGGAAIFAMSSAAFAQSAAVEPTPDAAATVTAPSEAADATAPSATGAPPPAVAQSTAPAAEAPMSAQAAPDAGEATAATVAPASAPAAPAEATASADAAAKVNAEWAKYDDGNKGKLTALEFGRWIMAAKGQDMSAQVEKTTTSKKADLPAVKVLNATATDFAKADTDKDRMISPNELAIYLSA